jgi:hypothetical protein
MAKTAKKVEFTIDWTDTGGGWVYARTFDGRVLSRARTYNGLLKHLVRRKIL